MNSPWKSCLTIVAVIVLVLSLCLNGLLIAGLAVMLEPPGGPTERPRYQEQRIAGDEHSKEKIVVLDLAGVILSEPMMRYGDSMADEFIAKLKQAREDEHVAAIVIRVDSPGGEVTASDVLYHEIAQTRAIKPVVIYMQSLAASGGYYAAMGGTYVVAHELTLTGSIGVLMETVNATSLLDKIGVRLVVFKSGQFKDLLNPGREITPAEMQLVQGMVNETYEKFLSVVASERKLAPAVLRDGLADGRVISGAQAKAAGLVDELGYLDDAIDAALEFAAISEAQVVQYDRPVSFSDLFRMFGQSRAEPTVRLELGAPIARLTPGKLYFLPASFFSAPSQ